MRKILGCMLALMLMLGTSVAFAKDKQNPVDQLTGNIWMESTQDNKLALIFGVECAIAIEQAIAEKMTASANANAKDKKKGAKKETVTYLSPFEKGWATAFENVTREKLVADLDAWYKANPDQLKRPVFAVIWDQFIAPKLPTR